MDSAKFFDFSKICLTKSRMLFQQDILITFKKFLILIRFNQKILSSQLNAF